MDKESKVEWGKSTMGFCFILFVAAIITMIIYQTDSYPLGNDVYGHLYKVDESYHSFQKGYGYPVFSAYWYSGIELFRYWPPLSYLFCTVLMFLCNGDIYRSYLLFLFLALLVGGAGIVWIGIKNHNVLLGTLLGVVYMLAPDNMRVMFSEGNMPRIFISALLPYALYFAYEFLMTRKRRYLIRINIMVVLLVCSHIMIAAMFGIATGLLCIVYACFYKEIKRAILLLTAEVLGYLESGIVLVPGLVGGIMTQSSEASTSTSADWSLEAIYSLNPATRLRDPGIFYFGLSLFLICIIGILANRKKVALLFWCVLIIFWGTTMIAYPIIQRLPGSQVLWMIRFVPMATCFLLMGILYWRELKTITLVCFVVLLLGDCALAYQYINETGLSIAGREDKMEQEYLLGEAYDIVENQLAVLDISNFGSYTSYGIIKKDREIRSLFGWSYQGAYTVDKIVQINEAFQYGYYDYSFSRLLEYGCDTIVVKKDEILLYPENLLPSAQKYGYELIDENENSYLLKYPDTGTFGTKPVIENICIGKGSHYISYLFPSYHEMDSHYLDDYAFEELVQYQKIYISGPYYHDKNTCEYLIRRLSKAGVKIYIDASNLPDERDIGKNSILGVYSQVITFTDKFPILEKENGSQFKIDPRTDKYEEWRASYFTGLDTVLKSSEYMPGEVLNYVGTKEGVTFVGLNLVYYCVENDSEDLLEFISEIFEETKEAKVDIALIPVTYDHAGNRLHFYTEEDDVLFGVSNLDSFEVDRETGNDIFVKLQSGDTHIRVRYAYQKEGIIVSLAGICLFILFMLQLKKSSARFLKEGAAL